MEARTFRDPSAFREFADPLLLEREARNNLILGVTGTLIDRPDIYPEFHLWAVEGDGVPLAVAAMTPPRPLLLADAASDSALDLLAVTIARSDSAVPGVIGNEPGVRRFVAGWAGETGEDPVKNMAQGVFALDRVRPVPQVSGAPRTATPSDEILLIDWVTAFLEEADPGANPDQTRSAVRRRLQSDQSVSGYWMWEVDGTPVSLTGHGGRTPNGIRIGPVYTPPEHRRCGYATVLVAEQSRWLLEQGRHYCFLYTNLADPTANSIYRRIGYRQVAESSRYSFTG